MDAHYALALVHAWLMRNPHYYSTYVAPYSQLRWFNDGRHGVVQRIDVGGHYRRKACCRNIVPSLAAVCRFERLVRPSPLLAPLCAFRARRDHDGSLLAPGERMFVLR